MFIDSGPKPLKRFTPPPEDYRPQESSSEPESDDEEDDEEDEDEDDGVVRSSDRPEDAELQQVIFLFYGQWSRWFL